MKRFVAAVLAFFALVVPTVVFATSQPIQVSTILTLIQSGISTTISVQGLAVSQSGSRYCQGVQAVPTTAGGTAMPCLSSLSNLGYAIFVNLDQTNYVDIMTATSGTAFIRLQPNDSALFRFNSGITAPAAIAHTAAVNLQFLVLEN